MDPTRMTTPEVLAQVKAIAQTEMGTDWDWNQEPYSRAHPAPQVISPRHFKLTRHFSFFGVGF
jgi:hypothetical protein